jgi:CheY-like chemotaxis protein
MPRVLVIDDQSHVLGAMLFALRAMNFDAVGVDTAAEGLRALGASKFDLVIADIYMPGMDGVKLIKAVRARYRDMPVIAMSGVQMPKSGRTALDFFSLAPDLSDVVCLQKPFRPAELMKAIDAATSAAKKTATETIP